MLTRILVIISCLLGVVAGVSAQDPAVRELVSKYDKNVRSFERYSCRFTLTEGDGTLSADPQDFKFTWTKKETIDCRYAVDGEYEAYEQFGTGRPDFGPAGVTPQAGTRFLKSTGIPAVKNIRGPRGYAGWMEVLKTLNLTGSEIKNSEASIETPLDLAFEHRRSYGPDHWIVNPNFIYQSIGEKIVLGKKCLGARFVAAKADNLTYEVWFDPEIGMLPRLVDTHQKGKHGVRTVIYEAKLHDKSKWFPTHLIHYFPDGFGRELILKELDLGKPSKKDLSVALPSGTVVKDNGTNLWFTLRRDETLSGTDLPELHEKVAQAQTDKKMDTALTHKGDRTNFWFWACGGAGLLLVSYGAYRWFRTRSRPIPVA